LGEQHKKRNSEVWEMRGKSLQKQPPRKAEEKKNDHEGEREEKKKKGTASSMRGSKTKSEGIVTYIFERSLLLRRRSDITETGVTIKRQGLCS